MKCTIHGSKIACKQICSTSPVLSLSGSIVAPMEPKRLYDINWNFMISLFGFFEDVTSTSMYQCGPTDPSLLRQCHHRNQNPDFYASTKVAVVFSIVSLFLHLYNDPQHSQSSRPIYITICKSLSYEVLGKRDQLSPVIRVEIQRG